MPPIAALWAVLQYVDLMEAPSHEGLQEALRRADPTVALLIAGLTGEQLFAELTAEPSIAVVHIMVAFTVRITGPVPLLRLTRDRVDPDRLGVTAAARSALDDREDSDGLR